MYKYRLEAFPKRLLVSICVDLKYLREVGTRYFLANTAY